MLGTLGQNRELIVHILGAAWIMTSAFSKDVSCLLFFTPVSYCQFVSKSAEFQYKEADCQRWNLESVPSRRRKGMGFRMQKWERKKTQWLDSHCLQYRANITAALVVCWINQKDSKNSFHICLNRGFGCGKWGLTFCRGWQEVLQYSLLFYSVFQDGF